MTTTADPPPPRKSALKGRRPPAASPLKSALRSRTTSAPARPRGYDPAADRAQQIAMFATHIENKPSRRGRPYSKDSIRCYLEAANALGNYLNEIAFGRGFEDITYVELNAFCKAYHDTHSLGGIVTKQGNLRMFFEWISDEFDVENAYKHRKHWIYRRSQGSPATLGDDFIEDILKTTSGRSFEDLRDNAIIRLFLLGPRLSEVEALQVEDIPLAGHDGPQVWFRPFKYAEDYRRVPIPPTTAIVLSRYLRARLTIPARPGPQGDLWLSLKGGKPLSKSGIYQMLRRRAHGAGYNPTDVHPHRFRHTAADKFMDGGQEGDAMQTFGWTDPSMPKHYGGSGASDRAFKAARRAGFGEYA